MQDSDKQSAIFRETVRKLEQGTEALRKGKRNPRFIIERKAVGSTHWKVHIMCFSEKRAKQLLPQDNENYEYRIRNGSHTT